MTEREQTLNIYRIRRAGSWAYVLGFIGLILGIFYLLLSSVATGDSTTIVIAIFFLIPIQVSYSLLFILLGKKIRDDGGVVDKTSSLWVLLIASLLSLLSVLGLVLFIFLIMAIVSQNKLKNAGLSVAAKANNNVGNNQEEASGMMQAVIELSEITVTANTDSLLVKNTSKFKLVDCNLVLNESYDYFCEVIKPKSAVKIAISEFSLDNGERFDVKKLKPRTLGMTVIKDGITQVGSYKIN